MSLFNHWSPIPAGHEKAGNEWLQQAVDESIWDAPDIERLFRISQPRHHQLLKAYTIPGHFQKGRYHFYIAALARPWFEEYVAKQTARASTKEAKKADSPTTKRARAPAKKRIAKKDRWRYFTWKGQDCVIPEGMNLTQFSEQMRSFIRADHGRADDDYSAGSPKFTQDCRDWSAIQQHLKQLQG